MYLNHFGLDEPPFRITPHTDFFFAGANRGATLEALLYAITHDEGIVKVTGEVGSGKTMLCRVLMERLPEQRRDHLSRQPVALARRDPATPSPTNCRSRAAANAVTIAAARAAGAPDQAVCRGPARGRPDRRGARHAAWRRWRRSGCSPTSSPTAPSCCRSCCSASPNSTSTSAMPHMRQLKERITHSFRLEPLMRSDIDSYIDFRMRAAGYRGPERIRAAGAAPHRAGLRGTHPAHQHPGRQVAARGVRRQFAPDHGQARDGRGARLRLQAVGQAARQPLGTARRRRRRRTRDGHRVALLSRRLQSASPRHRRRGDARGAGCIPTDHHRAAERAAARRCGPGAGRSGQRSHRRGSPAGRRLGPHRRHRPGCPRRRLHPPRLSRPSLRVRRLRRVPRPWGVPRVPPTVHLRPRRPAPGPRPRRGRASSPSSASTRPRRGWLRPRGAISRSSSPR